MNDAGASGRTRALDRGLMVLEALAGRAPLSLAEIAAECDLSAATALRILRTLELRGFVSRDPQTLAYSIGLKAFEVGSRFLSETRLTETVRLILRRLSSTTGQSTTLSILSGADIVHVDVQEGRSSLRSTPEIGMRAPAHATAAGKCLLAERWSDGLTDAIGSGPYPAMTERTITDRETLRAELAEVRRTRIATDDGELQPGISNAACVVRNRSGEMIAAIAIQAPSTTMDSHAEEWIPLLRTAAEEASHRLGWRALPSGSPTDAHMYD